MHNEVVLFDSVLNLDLRSVGRTQDARIADLTTTFAIERSSVKDDLELLLVFCLNLAITHDVGRSLDVVVPYEIFFIIITKRHPITSFNGRCVTRSLFLCLHLLFEFREVDRHVVFAQYEFSQVERESVGVVKLKGDFSAYLLLPLRLEIVDHAVQHPDARSERAQESFFFLLDDLGHKFMLRF